MNNTTLSALAVEAIEVANLETDIAKRAIHKPETRLESRARSIALDHMKQGGAAFGEIGVAFGMTATAVRKAIERTRP